MEISELTMQPNQFKRLPERTHDAFSLPPGAVASRQAASAAQWLARFASSWLPAEPANAQLMLRFEPERGVLVSRPAVAGLSLELTLSDLSMQLLENGSPSPHRMDVEDRTPAHVEAWLLVELLHRDIDRSRFSKALPWSVADLMNGDSEEFTPEALTAELRALAEAFTLARTVLAELSSVSPDSVLVSPDNFHIGVTVPSSAGPTAIVGLAPGDATIPEPHFYVARALPRPGSSAPPVPLLTMTEITERGMDAGQIITALRAAIAGAVGSKAAE